MSAQLKQIVSEQEIRITKDVQLVADVVKDVSEKINTTNNVEAAKVLWRVITLFVICHYVCHAFNLDLFIIVLLIDVVFFLIVTGLSFLWFLQTIVKTETKHFLKMSFIYPKWTSGYPDFFLKKKKIQLC